MAKSKVSREERLAKLREKLGSTDLGGMSQRFWSPTEGRNVIRVLPAVGDMDFFFQTVGRHYLPNKETVYCPQFTSEKELPCPICDLVNELYAAGDKASKELASNIRVSKRYWMNVIDRDNEDAGPLIFTPGVTVMNALASYINDPDYGDIFDEVDGLDMIIERTGKGLSTEYQVKASRKSTLLSDDDELIDEWIEKAHDLTWVEVSMDSDEDADLSGDAVVFLQPYDRIKAEHNLDFDDEDLEDEDPEEEEEEEAEDEVKKDVKKRQSTRRRSSRKK
jgi:hypothetical protein